MCGEEEINIKKCIHLSNISLKKLTKRENAFTFSRTMILWRWHSLRREKSRLTILQYVFWICIYFFLKASSYWLFAFKKRNHFVSRKVTKLVSPKAPNEERQINETITTFMAETSSFLSCSNISRKNVKFFMKSKLNCCIGLQCRPFICCKRNGIYSHNRT